MKPQFLCYLFLFFLPLTGWAEDGYQLWLRYEQIQDQEVLSSYRTAIQGYHLLESSPTLRIAEQELNMGLAGLLGKTVPALSEWRENGTVLVGTAEQEQIRNSVPISSLSQLKAEGYLIQSQTRKGKQILIIAGKGEIGTLYGVFHFLRLLQSHQSLDTLSILENPDHQLRILNHWDNLDRTVERGYAGFSIWDWHKLPEYLDQRYTDYARANASIGINGTVLTNVNANALILRPDYLEKVKALADLFRPFGIKVYLTARFSAPIRLGGLETADPLNAEVQQWWKAKTAEIYALIPDFGGFLVKANSEGQPGPQDYDRSHADGANMLADAVGPHGGVVMWRAFVYSEEEPEDRAKQANYEFEPLDGSFRDNVMIQVKNGPIDFQPREPFHPLFGAMPKTPLMMEFQITQEYLGQGTHLVYLAPMYKEVLDADTYAKGEGSTVAQIINGKLGNHGLSGIAGVANIGNDRNWTGHLFGQANWYAFGRLAWDARLSSEEIAEEWVRMSVSYEKSVVSAITSMMMGSHETCVNYMTPLGLHHIMAAGHHYGPGPWVSRMSRADWTSVYYHKADSSGIGFDRTPSGSDATSQYFSPLKEQYASRTQCPEKYLLWFHHVGWQETLSSGRSLWETLCRSYYQGANEVKQMRQTWQALEAHIDPERFRQVDMLLAIQEKEAIWWRDACLLYFQQFSGMEIPADLEPPAHGLEYYQELSHPYAPGIRPRW